MMYVLSTGCQWRAVPKACQRAAPCTAISACGNGTARSSISTTRSTRPAASRTVAKPVQPPQSSTARASRAPKKGVSIDRHGFDAGKKIKGKKRHLLVDTKGLLHAIVHAATTTEARCWWRHCSACIRS